MIERTNIGTIIRREINSWTVTVSRKNTSYEHSGRRKIMSRDIPGKNKKIVP
jgi:hypothetical protein